MTTTRKPQAMAELLARYRSAQSTPLPPITRELPACSNCRDQGWLHPTGVDGEPVYSQAVPCDCLLEKQRRHIQSTDYQRAHGVKGKQAFDNFVVSVRGARDAYDFTKQWTERKEFIWLLIYGGTGNGKTHLCNAALVELLNRGVQARLITASTFLSVLRKSMSDHTTDNVMTEYQQVGTLIIDDLGAGMKHPSEKGSEWEWGRIEELLVYRYENALPTMCATNLDCPQLPERIASRFGDTLMSRMVQNAAPDYRRER